MSDTILVDECLSVALVAVAKARGIAAVHAAHIGKGGWQAWNLVPFALANDYIVATKNRRHFLKEYLKTRFAQRPDHRGAECGTRRPNFLVSKSP